MSPQRYAEEFTLAVQVSFGHTVTNRNVENNANISIRRH